jgi:hypothetical protein
MPRFAHRIAVLAPRPRLPPVIMTMLIALFHCMVWLIVSLSAVATALTILFRSCLFVLSHSDRCDAEAAYLNSTSRARPAIFEHSTSFSCV